MMKTSLMLAAIGMLALALLTGCNSYDDDIKGGNAAMDEIRIQEIVEILLKNDITMHDYLNLEPGLRNTAFNRVIADPDFTFRDRQLEAERQRRWHDRRYRMSHMQRENSPVDVNTLDLSTVVRFGFLSGVSSRVSTLAIDGVFDIVYRDTDFHRLQNARYSATLIEGDMERLIQAIEGSNLLHWPEWFEGVADPYIRGEGSHWTLGILFEDNTVIRRGGSGFSGTLPPIDEWNVLFDFVQSFGQEIIERHAIENPQSNKADE